MTLKKLPIGSQTFSTIIEEDAIYVDKTRYLYDLINSSPVNKFFLSRPRRFGKSLTLSTLDAIFSGKKELFKGLYIAEKTDYKFQKFSVLRFDFSNIAHRTGVELERTLKHRIIQLGQAYQVSLGSTLSIPEIWSELVLQLSLSSKVVILIDEYDKPILDHITNIPIAKENRDVLKGFYEVIKANDEHVRFVFITGITKFSQMNIFSGMNNLKDLTLDMRYAGMLGYTQDELEDYFKDHITVFAEHELCDREVLIKKIKSWYNGFRFTQAEVKVYNPFSTLLLLDSRQFSYHWFSTGTPTYLMELIESGDIDVTGIEGNRLTQNHLSSYNLDTMAVNFTALLYQTGYLTIVNTSDNGNILTLGYPNQEVKMAFTECLLDFVSHSTQAPSAITVVDLKEALESNDIEHCFSILKLFFSKIPYDIQIKQEKYYQSLFHLIFTLIGTRIRAEVRTHMGRIDALIETASHLYLFEFKLDGTAEEALTQIQTKDYAFGIKEPGKKTTLIGVAFSTHERNITDTAIKTLK